MVLFCVFWPVSVFFIWRMVRPQGIVAGEAFALIAGSAAAVVRFFVPVFVDPGGFGLFRWISAFTDFACLPVLYLLAVFFLLSKTKTGITDLCGFMLCALIPISLVRSILWSIQNDLIRLVLTPFLWTSLIISLYPIINLPLRNSIIKKILGVFLFLILLGLAASSWWAFFGQKNLYASMLLLPEFALMVLTIIVLYKKKFKTKVRNA
jgi:hypothetical protein